MWSTWQILWALTCQIHVVVGKHQATISSSMNNCGTKHKVILPTSKLNSSDFQVWGAGIFLLPLQERVTPALFKNVIDQSCQDSRILFHLCQQKKKLQDSVSACRIETQLPCKFCWGYKASVTASSYEPHLRSC
jgi:hypothetical protein